MKINLFKPVKVIFVALISFELLLVCLDIVFSFFRLLPSLEVQRLFNVAREDSISNWYSSVQTFLVGLTLWGIYCVKRIKKVSGISRRGWAILGTFFMYLGVDDGTGIHEKMGGIFEGAGPWVQKLMFFPSYSWHLILGPVLIGFAIYILYFLWTEMGNRKLLILAFMGLACFGIAETLDFIEGLALTDDYTINHFRKIVEEFLEMAGSTFFLVSFIGKLLSEISKIRFVAHEGEESEILLENS